MKADDLRASILQAAIQGNLTKQDPNDEPASVLVERIREEKHRLVKEGKIKRDKNESFIFKRDGSWFETINGKDERCIDDEIPFDIPDNWIWIRLSSISTKIGSGKTPSGGKTIYKQSGVTFIRSQNVYNDGLRLENVAYIDQSIHDTMAGTALMPSDILLNITGASIGRSSIVPLNLGKANVNQHVMIIRIPDSSIVEFIHLVIISPYFYNEIMKLQVGATKEGLSAQKAGSMFIPIAPLKEQNLIINTVWNALEKIIQLDKLESDFLKLNDDIPIELKKSILFAAIQGKLTKQDPNDEPASVLVERIREEKHRLVKEGKIKRDKNESFIFKRDGSWFETINGKDERCIDDEIPFDIPENWIFSRMSSVSILKSGVDLSSDKYNDQGKGIVYITGASNIKENGVLVNRWTEHPKNIANLGDILLVCKGSTGKCTISDVPVAHIARQIMAITPISISARYLLAYFKLIESKLNGASKGTIPGIERRDVLSLLVPIPPMNEQKNIINSIDRLMELIESLRNPWEF